MFCDLLQGWEQNLAKMYWYHIQRAYTIGKTLSHQRQGDLGMEPSAICTIFYQN